jgi:F-type H+-transporting ATPase subunit gamma
MANTRQIKRRITASQNISKITKAMEMVAASKMKRAQDQALSSRPYSHALLSSLKTLSQFSDPSLHPLLATHETGQDILILFSTDKGLCGGLNTTLFKQTLQWAHTHQNPAIVAIGKKAITFCRLAGLTIYAQFTELPERVTASDLVPISTLVIDGFMDLSFKSVHILYMDFINTLSQKPNTVQLLPIVQADPQHDMITPQATSEYTFEPSAVTILKQLLPYYIENTIFQTMLESRASENSARMVAMKNASENAKELVGELKLIYNKSRQANITNELLDITTAALTTK